ncbi:MAG: hypothetical protein KDC43_24445 [Saprospiraceae bacterium]|nr:hypothetical protein [Saprospiraceae bacterium]
MPLRLCSAKKTYDGPIRSSKISFPPQRDGRRPAKNGRKRGGSGKNQAWGEKKCPFFSEKLAKKRGFKNVYFHK